MTVTLAAETLTITLPRKHTMADMEKALTKAAGGRKVYFRDAKGHPKIKDFNNTTLHITMQVEVSYKRDE